MTLPPEPLLSTKLLVPPLRPARVRRDALLARLNRGLAQGCRLTLASAAPGYGKTTLVAEWAGQTGRPVAWVSLEARENDPARFWRYVGAGLRAALPGALDDLPPPPASPAAGPLDDWLDALINRLAATGTPVVLVLDDYQVITAEEVHRTVNLFLDRLPAHAHVAITTRTDPPLNLSLRRGRAQMQEARAADLSLSLAQSADFLNAVMALDLTAEQVRALHARSEGWITALQLAALALTDRAGRDAFIEAFAESSRDVSEYLVGEALRRQPDDVARFLLRTSILERLCGELCDAVTGGADGPAVGGATGDAMLRRLEAANLFLQPVDAARRWYRYHPLFSSQVLATHLREAPGEAEAGHRRASAWFEARGLARDAIRHALAGHDISHAVALLEAALADLAKEGQVTDFDAWLTQVPAETRANPRLALAFTWSAMYRGELGQVRDRVGAVERLLAGHPEPDAAAARDYACQVASLRSWLALFLDLDPAAGLTRARQAVALAPGLEPMIQAGAVHCLAHAHFAAGDVAAADRAFGDSVALAQAGGSVYSEILVTYFWAATMLEAGRLTVARELCLWLLARHAEPAAHAALLTPIHYALALIEYERSELEAAERWLALVGAAEVKIGYAAAAARLLAARVALARGEAVAVGEAAAALPYVSFRSALAPGPHALDVWLRTGRVDLARAAARAWGLGNLPPGPLTLAELTARAAILRADGDPRASLALTAQLGPIAEGARLDGHAVRILIERALALAAAGDGAGALGALGRALDLAAKEGFVRAFVDAGPEMAALLQLACARGDGGPYARTLLDAFGPARGAEPLTAREREVLALLARRMSYAEISAALVVSLNTVRTHVKSIYAKLGVGSAEEAVARAGEGAFGTRRRGV